MKLKLLRADLYGVKDVEERWICDEGYGGEMDM